MSGGWSPDCQCPDCGRTPNVGFSIDEVRRAKRERQAARMTSVKCPRCGTTYWIRARDVARATPPDFLVFLDAPTVAVLRERGLTGREDVERLRRLGKLGEVEGVGPARERRIREALDASARAMVA